MPVRMRVPFVYESMEVRPISVFTGIPTLHSREFNFTFFGCSNFFLIYFKASFFQFYECPCVKLFHFLQSSSFITNGIVTLEICFTFYF